MRSITFSPKKRRLDSAFGRKSDVEEGEKDSVKKVRIASTKHHDAVKRSGYAHKKNHAGASETEGKELSSSRLKASQTQIQQPSENQPEFKTSFEHPVELFEGVAVMWDGLITYSSTCRIYKASKPLSGREAVVKFIEYKEHHDPNLIRNKTKVANNEIDRLTRLPRHPNVVTYLGHGREPCKWYIYLERCDEDLLSWATRHPSVWDPRKFMDSFMPQMARAVKHCHDNGLCHRDIKPENFLLVDQEQRVVLCDFGMSAACGKGIYQSEPVGSPDYVSPEIACCTSKSILRYDGAASDIFSLGTTFFSMLCKKSPFRSGDNVEATQVLEAICTKSVSFERYGQHVDKEIQSLILDMMQKHPLERVDISEVVLRLELRKKPAHSREKSGLMA